MLALEGVGRSFMRVGLSYCMNFSMEGDGIKASLWSCAYVRWSWDCY